MAAAFFASHQSVLLRYVLLLLCSLLAGGRNFLILGGKFQQEHPRQRRWISYLESRRFLTACAWCKQHPYWDSFCKEQYVERKGRILPAISLRLPCLKAPEALRVCSEVVVFFNDDAKKSLGYFIFFWCLMAVDNQLGPPLPPPSGLECEQTSLRAKP